MGKSSINERFSPRLMTGWCMYIYIYIYLFIYLVGGFKHFLFFHVLGTIIPTDFLIFQRGRSTTNQKCIG